MKIITALLSCLITAAVGAQDVTDFHKLLIPITPGEIQGAKGSVWATTLTLSNVDSEEATIGFRDQGACQTQCPTVPVIELGPLSTRVVTHTSTDQSYVGIFLYVEGTPESTLGITLRSQDLSRALETWGTAIPVVGSDQLYAERFALTDIPMEDQFRATLRLYDYDPQTQGTVEVRVYRLDTEVNTQGDDLLSAQSFGFRYPATESEKLLYPGVIELPLSTLYPNVGRVLIVVTPEDDARDYWGFVSVTHNDTQHVTLTLPQ